ncbi:APC family permease [Micromonospora sp. HUAS LYJ1]|uniref:APC family permease n=1 Tax=Micromonospora sp. HUAS LYJ1 TaxID=3061626 RepID=UPI002673139D|nr:APC family permease [Micromonospora sp. HUAS LYJ1]WKU07071.1 APC family permease [Micromonospora sp. HUAS LYJ1]
MSPTSPDTISTALARGRLGIPSVVFFVIAAAAPLTVVAGGATTGYAVTGVTGIPVAYLVVAAVLALFAVGYVAMSRHIVNAGAFYTYVTRGLGRPAGVAAAAVALLAYNAMQIGLYGGFGAVLAQFLHDRYGWAVTWWLCALTAWAAVTVLGVLRIDLNGTVLAVMLTAECAIVVVFDTVMITHPAATVTVDTLAPTHVLAAGIGAALVTAITGFVGFEATVVFSEETKDPRRTVAHATYLAVTVTGLLYGLSAWAMSVATGPNRIVDAARTDGTDLIFHLVTPHLDASVVTIGRVLFITSLFAALLSFHHTVARYLFALGREHVIPAAFGRTSRHTGAPKIGSITQSGLALTALAGYAATDADPIVHLFFWITVTGGLGILILMTATSTAVLGYFTRRTGHHEGHWRATVAPLTATLTLAAILTATLREFDTLLGVDPHSPLRWLFPAAYAAAALLGAVWALTLRTTNPPVYAAIGLGADSHTLPLRNHPTRQPA